MRRMLKRCVPVELVIQSLFCVALQRSPQAGLHEVMTYTFQRPRRYCRGSIERVTLNKPSLSLVAMSGRRSDIMSLCAIRHAVRMGGRDLSRSH
ncbi:hypothetical protein C8Q76DRAFT_77650 [Earliella scabrosa]|nr:hypothetical protein C8Q76DRAFT_77650 [Earliella scabrosa]